tara:strand:- start:281 stop:433 length:153 start_codon:yes stop_codon:yes gene_type:complete
MYKFLLVLTVVALTACGSSKTTSETPADSTAVVTDSVTVTDSVVVDTTAK